MKAFLLCLVISVLLTTVDAQFGRVGNAIVGAFNAANSWLDALGRSSRGTTRRRVLIDDEADEDPTIKRQRGRATLVEQFRREREDLSNRITALNSTESFEAERKERELAIASFYSVTPQQLIRNFTYAYYDLTVPKDKKLTGQQIRDILEVYSHKQHYFEAGLDTYDYSALKGTDYDDPEKRAAWFYTMYPPKGYYVDFPNP